jgi:DNA-binding transcriptional LysR family regulator
MIDRYLLRYFLAVIDHGSFSKAAKQANVSQPTLSIGIAKLERLLGKTMFHRTSKRVELTDAGARFAVHARRIESEFNLAQAAVLEIQPVAALRLGVISSLPMGDVAARLGAVRRQRASTEPPERLQIVTGSERELLQRLRRGQLEVALTLVRTDSGPFTSEVLFSERYALALPADHPLAARPTIAAEELAENTMIVRRHCEALAATSRHFTERGVRPFFALRSTNDEQVLALVQAGLGVTVMPMCFRFPGVVRPLLTGFPLQRRIGLVYAEHAAALRHGDSPLLGAIRAGYAPAR